MALVLRATSATSATTRPISRSITPARYRHAASSTALRPRPAGAPPAAGDSFELPIGPAGCGRPGCRACAAAHTPAAPRASEGDLRTAGDMLGGGAGGASGLTHVQGPAGKRASAHGPPPQCGPVELLLSPSALSLRKETNGLLHLGHLLPPGLEGEQAWRLSSFHVVKHAYTGYASNVYVASHKASNTCVALKVYDIPNLPSMLQYQCFREVDVHGGQHHPHILQLYAAFVEDGRLVLVLEFAGGGDLSRVWRDIGRSVPEARLATHVLRPLLEALSSIHGRNIAHRDIKPANILFTVREAVSLKLADFGAAIDMSAEAAVTRTGTGPYMAPEVNRAPLKHAAEDNKLEAGLQYNQAVDIWSLGVMAYELLVGLRPDVDALRRVADEAATAQAELRNRCLSASVGASASAPPAGNLGRLRERMALLLPFPKGVSPAARNFVLATLRPLPEERPTAAQLLSHPWIDGCDAPQR